MMKKNILLLMLMAFTVVQFWGCDDDTNIWGQVKGSGDIITIDYSFANFTRIEASNAFLLTVRQADSFFVQLHVDDNLSKYLEVNKNGSWIEVGLDDGKSYTDVHLTAIVHMPNINYLKGSGACDIELDGFASESDFMMELSGASDFSGNLDADECEIYVSGASTVNLNGSCNELFLEASGASNLNMGDFIVGTANFLLSGASDGTVHVTDNMDVSISGASTLRYYGDPQLGNINISGASDLIKL